MNERPSEDPPLTDPLHSGARPSGSASDTLPGSIPRDALEREWFALTRKAMPAAAVRKGWPVHLDHCFQRILLDNACEGRWRDHVASPAYRNAPHAVLARAVTLGRATLRGDVDLAELNRRSLEWRGRSGPRRV